MEAAATERQKSVQKEIQASTQPTQDQRPPINILTQMHSSTIQVSMYEALLPEVLDYFRHKVTTFKAGCLAAHAKEWQSDF